MPRRPCIWVQQIDLAGDVRLVAVARLDDDATDHDIGPLTERLWMSAFDLDPPA